VRIPCLGPKESSGVPDLLLHIPLQPPHRFAEGQRELRIGRTPDQDLVIDDPLISRTHARLFWKQGVLYLEDLGSKHGSFLNGARIRSPHPVSTQDELQLGGTGIRLEEIVPVPGWAEETLALPVANLRSWIKSDTSQERFPDWREALDLLHELSLHMLQDLPSTQFLGDLLDRLFTFLDASRGAVLLPDEVGELTLLASRMKERASGAPLLLSPATVKAALQRREALLLKEPRTQQPGSVYPSAESVTATVMAVPLEHAGEVLGLLYFDASRARLPFTEDDLRFVASLGNLAAAKLLQQRMAAELRRKQDLERKLEAVAAAAKAKSEFLTHMSHEIRTPMNAILGFTHVAMGEAQTVKAADCLRKIDQSGRALVNIINDILDASKLEAGKLELEAVPFQVRDVLQDTRDLFLQRVEEKGLALSLETSQEVPEVLVGDPLRLGQVLINLVDNALKFTECGRVELRVECVSCADARVCLRFSVEDTGIGLAPEQIERLFTNYTQAETSTTRRYGGTGLGLVISKRLVEMMGGAIQIASEPGVGSTFSFTARFPLGSAQAATPHAGHDRTALSAVQDRREWRILLVEDNAVNQELGRILLGDAGMQVEVAGSGAEALRMVDEGSYDAVLMDVEMPGMDGWETTRRLRAGHPQLPIIAMTAHAFASHRDQCLAAGMNDCLVKPIDPGRLFEVLGTWIGSKADSRKVPGSEQDLFAGLEAVMNVQAALDRLDGRADLLKHFLKAFLEDPANAVSIREALVSGDRATACLLIHNLKGMAGSLAIEAVAAAADELETWLRSKESGDWEPRYQPLYEALGRFQNSAQSLLGPSGS
jgi:signal transduction histidine kinase/CheY-like chemotaxis protein